MSTSERPLAQIAPQLIERQSIGVRQSRNFFFVGVCICAASLTLLILVVLLGTVAWQGMHVLDAKFLTSANSMTVEKAGIYPAMLGSLYVCFGCALFSLPLGVGTAIFLEEFRPRNRILRHFRGFVQLNIANLAGVPSVVYGILGLTAFVNMFGLFGSPLEPAFEFGVTHYKMYSTDNPRRFVRVPVASASEHPDLKNGLPALGTGNRPIELRVIPRSAPKAADPAVAGQTVREGSKGSPVTARHWYYLRLPFGVSVLAGSLTLMLVILPMVIITSQEALRAVPDSLREGALGMGATPWQTVWHITLPSSLPGIMTGTILAMSRAIGEAAPILIISGIVFIQSPPGSLLDKFSVMPLQIYNWAQQPSNQGFHALAAGGIIVLLAMLLVFNGLAVFIRHRLQKPLS